MKTIVLVINDLKGNGAERVVITLADQLIAQGHRCHIICFKRFQELPSANKLKMHIFPMQYLRWLPRKWRSMVVAPLLDRFIRKQSKGTPDLILSNLLPVDRILCDSKLPNVHLIMHNTLSKEHLQQDEQQDGQQTFGQLERIYTKKPIICVSQGVFTDFKSLFPYHTGVQRIYNPVDEGLIKQGAQQPNPLTEKHYLIHVGKFKAAKRHDRLLRAYAKSGISTPLVLVGQGPLLKATQTLAQELGIAEQVIFAGFHANPYPLIAASDGMVLSSDYEGLGLVILEALVLGVPVISTDCPSGPNEILPPNNLVAVDDENAFAKKIADLAAKPSNFKTPFSADFSPETAAEQYLSLASTTA